MTMGDSSGVKRPLMVRAFFVSLVLSVFVGPRVTRWLHAGEPAGEYGFRFEESARALGIDFVHEVTPPDTLIDNLGPWIQGVVTASAAVCDVNADGWPDMYVTNSAFGSKNRLYLNREGAAFEDVAKQAGVADVNQPGTGVSTGAACADYDNDGDEDLLVHKYGSPELFRNQGDGTLTRVTQEAGGAKW